MTLWQNLKKSLRFLQGSDDPFYAPQNEGESARERDILTAIRSLNLEIDNDPNGIETYLALGSLYRARGDIERAIQIRSALMVRPGIDDRVKARIYFELGLDYKHAGLVDRAFNSLEEALSLGAPAEIVHYEIALLYADSGDYAEAAKVFSYLGHAIGEAHYLARAAEEYLNNNEEGHALASAKRAIRAFSASVEAWLLRIKIAAKTADWKDVQKSLHLAITKIEPHTMFLLFEGLLAYLKSGQNSVGQNSTGQNRAEGTESNVASEANEIWQNEFSKTVLEELATLESNPLIDYYHGLFLICAKKSHEASVFFEKAILSEPGFWAARLELMGLNFLRQNLSPLFSEQINFFLSEGRSSKRFICSKCGFRWQNIFFICPRCRTWHSALFRHSLKD